MCLCFSYPEHLGPSLLIHFLQQHDRDILFAARRRSRSVRGGFGARAGFAVGAKATMTVFTLIAVEHFAKFAQSIKQWDEQTPALGQNVFDVWRAAAVISSLDERVLLHIAKASDQCSAADRMKRLKQFRRSPWPMEEVAHHQHRPLIADQLQRARHRAPVTFASSHAFALL